MNKKRLQKVLSILVIVIILVSVFAVPCYALTNVYDEWCDVSYYGSGTRFDAYFYEENYSYYQSSVNMHQGIPFGVTVLNNQIGNFESNMIVPYYDNPNYYMHYIPYDDEVEITRGDIIDLYITTPKGQTNGVFEYYVDRTNVIGLNEDYHFTDAYISYYIVFPYDLYAESSDINFFEGLSLDLYFNGLYVDYTNDSQYWNDNYVSIPFDSEYLELNQLSYTDSRVIPCNRWDLSVKNYFSYYEVKFYYNTYFLDNYVTYSSPIENVYNIGFIYKDFNCSLYYDFSVLDNIGINRVDDLYYYNSTEDAYTSWYFVRDMLESNIVPTVGYTIDNDYGILEYEDYSALNNDYVYQVIEGYNYDVVSLAQFNLFNWLGTTLGGILDINIVGTDTFGISLGGLLGVGLFVSVFLWFLKTFAGG